MRGLFRKRFDVSIVVVAYAMARELPRILYSLTGDYQRHCAGIDYEVLVSTMALPSPSDTSGSPPTETISAISISIIPRLPRPMRSITVPSGPVGVSCA